MLLHACADIKHQERVCMEYQSLFRPETYDICIRGTRFPGPNEKKRKSEGGGVRAKRMKITPCCEMKMVMAKEFDTKIELQKVTISLHTDRKSPCSSHNHTFDYSDSIKLNSAVWLTAGQEVAKGYTPAVVNRNLQGVKWAGNRDALKEAGGTYLDLKAVHNAGGDFKKTNPDIRMKGSKEEWEIQLNDCQFGYSSSSHK